MLVYLSKKIAIPNDTILTTVCWHSTRGWIACGGEDGLLKVLKLDVQPTRDAKLKGLAAPSNLSMNQSLEGHNGSLQVVTWNESHHKLTSSDHNGLIIVWMLYKGMWYEEMINNRNKSVVRHMVWNKEGSKICIVYEDGAVIVGSVDGGRIWGKELKGLILTHVQWSPDCKVILFGNSKGEIHIYDSHGTYNTRLAIRCLVNVTGLVKLIGVEWYDGRNGYAEPNCPTLVVVYDNGRAQLMRHELDDNVVLLDTKMSVVSVKWNHNGSMLAFAGTQRFQEGKQVCTVQFYNMLGEHLHTLKVPGRNLCAVTWEGTGLRVALGVGSFIYFANIRHDYKWGYFSDTLVYSFRKPDKLEHCVIFWNTVTGDRHPKSVKNLICISSCKDYCVLVVKLEEEPGMYTLLLCNALGTPVDTRHIEMEPTFVCISHTHVVAASKTSFFTWYYRTTSRLAAPELTHVSSKKGREGQDRLIHIDDHPSGTSVTTVDFTKATIPTMDQICSFCASEKLLVVARVSGTIQYYSLPKLALEGRTRVDCRPQYMALNCISKKLSVIDIHGVLYLYELKEGSSGTDGQRLPLERKEVWNLKWAEDNPDLFAMMEKTRMYIFRGTDPEEPVVSSGHICTFKSMQVRSALLDEVMKDPENTTEDLIMDLDIKSLRDTRDLLSKVSLGDACQFIEDNPHPRLWRLLAESSLEKLDLEMAEKAFVCCKDYQGIQFVKRLKKLDSELKQKAEVAAYFKRFEEAERMYLEMDRKDLAVDLRMKLGDWFRVVQLLKTGGGAGDDTLLIEAWNAIGDYYADRQKWHHAVTYYTQGRNNEKLFDCYYVLEDYAALDTLASTLPENNPLLAKMAPLFVAVGMCEQAVDAYLKLNRVEDAVQCCVELNQWDLAVELAKKHDRKGVDGLLAQYASVIMEKEKILSAIELYRKANHYIEGAKLLTKVARGATTQSLSPLKIKKLYVLAACLIESHHDKAKHNQQIARAEMIDTGNKKGEVLSTLQGLLSEDYSSAAETALLDNPWRGAEAYHFFLLAQRQLYTGQAERSLKTALYLCDYEDILPVVDIYSLLALCSSASSAFGVCSKAFTTLESLDNISEDTRQMFESVAMDIFTKHPPKDVVSNRLVCPSCDTPINDWVTVCPSCDTKIPVCIASGQPLLDYESWMCDMCKHRAHEHEIQQTSGNCPLCHYPTYLQPSQSRIK